MNCNDVKKRLPLYAGGDLPERETMRIQEHLETCPDCTGELELYQHARSAVDHVAGIDRPESLPSDFAMQVQRRIAAERVHSRNPFRRHGLWQLPKLVPIGAVAALIAILLFALSQDRWLGDTSDRAEFTAANLDEQSLVEISALLKQYGDAVEGPYPVDTWNPSGASGVYMLMHRPLPGEAPETYSLDYCGASNRLLSFRGNPWIRQRQGRLVARAGSPNNVYIVIIVLPESSGDQRRRIEDDIRKKYQPYFNRRNGV